MCKLQYLDVFNSSVKFRLSACHHDNFGSLFRQLLSSCKPNARASTSHDSYFALELQADVERKIASVPFGCISMFARCL
jgi:hypothetical protein